jgi:glycosyltransferase involved in cell wall biosynthesis
MAGATVSVITATYNSSRTLRVALSSLLAQTFTDWEGWIVGDGCTDDSESVVRSFRDARLNWANLDRNYGSQSFPNNEGLRRAAGKYVAYLGHDDIWFPSHLSELMQCIDSSQADLVHSICGSFGPDALENCFGPPKKGLSYEGHFVPPSCILHRRSLIETAGFWCDPAVVAIPPDVEYLRRIVRSGARIEFVRRLTVVKIISSRIRLYSFAGEPPQVVYWRRIESDFPEFQREILGTAATELARFQTGGDEPFSAVAHGILESWRRSLRSTTEEWPIVSCYWRWKYDRFRRRRRTMRGLPA